MSNLPPTLNRNVRLVRSVLPLVAALAATSLLTGCGTTFHQRNGITAERLQEPLSGKALINFHRPSGYLGGLSLVAFDSTGEFVGVVPGRSELQWNCDPGEHILMTWGQERGKLKGVSSRVSVLKAEVEAGKVYDVMVDASPWGWVASITLYPLKKEADRRARVEEFERREQVVLRGVQDTEEVRKFKERHQKQIEDIKRDFLGGSKGERVVTLEKDDCR
jgi:hypothetical protein